MVRSSSRLEDSIGVLAGREGLVSSGIAAVRNPSFLIGSSILIRMLPTQQARTKMDTDPAKLASSSDIPVTISLLDRHEAFVTFGEYRLMKQERLMDWLDMVQTGTFRTTPDIEPSTEVLPRLHKPEGATASTPLDAVRLMMNRYESSKHHQE